MSIERMATEHGWCCSDIVDGYLVTRRYIGYTKREARSLFAEYVEQLKRES